MNDIVFTTRNLHKWVKDEKAPDIDLAFKFMNPKIRKDPLGCVLVIGYAILNLNCMWTLRVLANISAQCL